MDNGRRGFLFGRARPVEAQQRPPWALTEAAFIDCCTRCNDCLKACPTSILIAGNGGFPTVDFSCGECTFCGECVTACRPQALRRNDPAEKPWHVVAVIAASCLAAQRIECRSCGDYCDARAIRFSPRLGACPQPEIDTEKCTGCGACVAPCPARAISVR